MNFWHWFLLGALLDQIERNRQLAERNRILEEYLALYGDSEIDPYLLDTDEFKEFAKEYKSLSNPKPTTNSCCGTNCAGCGCLIGLILTILILVSFTK